MALFDTHIVVDWSARSKPGPRRPTKDSIWWAVARDGVVEPPAYVRTRHEAVIQLEALLASEAAAGRRVLAGFDFPFGYPAGVAQHLTGHDSAFALWEWIAERIRDREDNGNNRFDVATEINGRYPGVGPCWGRPAKWPYPEVPTGGKARTRSDGHPPERRLSDKHAKGAKTIWQLFYNGSVGSQALVGLPALQRLTAGDRLRGRVSVWPLDGGLRVPTEPVVFAELYPSLLRQAVETLREPGEILDAAQVRVNADAFARLDARDGLAELFSGSPALTAEQRRIVETEEAWVLGLGHEDALLGALG